MPFYPMRDGHPLYVRRFGRGPACVLLHGFGMHSAHWLPVLWPLRNQFHFILPDFRGFGRSHHTPLAHPCVLSQYANDLHDLADHLHLQQVALGGISMGAYVALQYQRHYGLGRFSRYLHIDQAPHCRNDASWAFGMFGEANRARFAAMERLQAIARQFDPRRPYQHLPAEFRQALQHELARFFAYALKRQPHPKWVAWYGRQPALLKPLINLENWAVYFQCMEAYLTQDYDMRPLLEHINIPVSLIVGMQSRMYPAEGQLFMLQRLPRVQAYHFRRSGHVPMWDEPVKFMKTLKEFMVC